MSIEICYVKNKVARVIISKRSTESVLGKILDSDVELLGIRAAPGRMVDIVDYYMKRYVRGRTTLKEDEEGDYVLSLVGLPSYRDFMKKEGFLLLQS